MKVGEELRWTQVDEPSSWCLGVWAYIWIQYFSLISELMKCFIIGIGIPRARATLITDNATAQSFGQLLVFNFNLESALNFEMSKVLKHVQ